MPGEPWKGRSTLARCHGRDRAPPLPRHPALPLLLPSLPGPLALPAQPCLLCPQPEQQPRDVCSPRVARAVALEKAVSPLRQDVTAPDQKGQGLQQLVSQSAAALPDPGCPRESPVLSKMLKTQDWRGAVLPTSHSR